MPVIMCWRIGVWRKIHKAGHLQQHDSNRGDGGDA
jgi:hypothetical protein